jgi:hypothetical protein
VSHEDLQRLGELVMDDNVVGRRLAALEDQGAFVETVVTLARKAGLTVTPEDIEVGLTVARDRWNQRWI